MQFYSFEHIQSVTPKKEFELCGLTMLTDQINWKIFESLIHFVLQRLSL